jgi:hypothetical protein
MGVGFIFGFSGFDPGYQAGIEKILSGYQVLGDRNIVAWPLRRKTIVRCKLR